MAGGITLGFLKFVLGFDSLAFEQGSTNAQKEIRRMERQFQRTAASIGDFGRNLTAAITVPLAGIAAVGIAEAQATAQAMAQVNAALTSMGPVAGRSADQLSRFADQLELNSLFEADDILKSVTANLLTFGNVAGDNFDRAQQAAVDLATRMGTDLQAATISIGRALNDPVKGMTALGRAGIQFTDAQKAAIEAMVAGGDAAGAQAVILGELERQFGGAAAAAQNTDPMNRATDAFKQMAETIGVALLPVLPIISDAVVRMLGAFTSLSPEAQKFLIIAGGIAAAVGPLAIGLGAVVNLLAPMAAAISAASVAAGAGATGFGALALAALPFVAIAAGIAAAGVVIYQNWDKIAPVLQEIGTYVMAALGPTLIDTFNRIKTTVMELWNGPFGTAITAVFGKFAQFQLAWLSAFGPVALTVLRVLIAAVGNIFEFIGNVLNTLGALLTGDFSGAWKYAQEIVTDVVAGFGRIIEAVFPGALTHIAALYNGVKTWLQDRLGAVFQWVIGKVQAVGTAFYNLYDAVVGNSYVPDMVDEIGQHMRRLDAELVTPARTATERAAEQFRNLQTLLNRLFPERRAALEYQADLATLRAEVDAGRMSWGLYAAAVARANEQQRANATSRFDFADTNLPEVNVAPVISDQQVEDVLSGARRMANGVETQNVRIIESFAQMADGALQSLDKLINGIKKGNIGDIISGILGALDKIGGMTGGFNIGGLQFGGARAAGGPVTSGRQYLVGERGPELFTAGRSGMITSNDNLRRGGASGGLRISVEPTDMFRIFVRDEAGNVVAQAAPAMIKGGSAMAQSDLSTRRRYTIPA